MSRTIKEYMLISIKGIAMGAADIVPGVSGGTIAFITGIYEELIESIDNINLGLFNTLRKDGFKKFWTALNGNFLLSLFLGIIISILSLANLMKYLLEHQAVMTWSFFFGLILGSAWLIGKSEKGWKLKEYIALIVGSSIAYYITVSDSIQSPNSYPFLILAGAIASCAMILPGISGSFILLLLGKYKYIMQAISDIKILDILSVALGVVIGLLSFSKFLNWLFKTQKKTTMALLTGFMIGSLNKVWPWRNTITTALNRHGIEIPVLQKSVLPQHFEQDPQIILAILCSALGLVLIFFVQYGSKAKEEKI